jgi:NAD(P)-dependent dehydrogenase (short-subunit alcohol dehydrogenase family)
VDEKAGPGLATEISTSGPGKVQFVRCDVRSWDDQINLFETAVKNSPNNSCDIVLANAGIAGQPFELLQEDGKHLT